MNGHNGFTEPRHYITITSRRAQTEQPLHYTTYTYVNGHVDCVAVVQIENDNREKRFYFLIPSLHCSATPNEQRNSRFAQ